MSNPKVSVIIPVYNVEKYIENCLQSIIQQTLDTIEIIVIDDGSTDSSSSIIQRYEKEDNITIITKENGGASSARNVGLSVARGKYVYFMDSDDTLEKGTLLILYNAMEMDELDQAIMSPRNYTNQDDEVIDRIFERYYNEILSGKELFRRLIINVDFCSGPPYRMVRREVLDKYQMKFYEGIIYEDELFTFNLMMVCNRIRVINRKLYNTTFRPDSVTASSELEKKFISYATIVNEMIEDKYWLNATLEQKHSIYQYFNERFNGCSDYYYAMEKVLKNKYKELYKVVRLHTKQCNYFNNKKIRILCHFPWIYVIYYKMQGLRR